MLQFFMALLRAGTMRSEPFHRAGSSGRNARPAAVTLIELPHANHSGQTLLAVSHRATAVSFFRVAGDPRLVA